MAFTEFCCRSGGSNLNAGTRTGSSTEPGTSADFTYASGDWVASTGVFTVASGNPSSDGVAVGDFASVYADGSSVTDFVGRVTARDATTITVSLTAKSGTAPTDGTSNRTLKIGGAWQGPNGAVGFPFGFVAATMMNVGGDTPRVNFKNSAQYNITAMMVHTLAGPCQFEGYASSFGDGGRATFDGGTSGGSFRLLQMQGTDIVLEGLIVQNNGSSGSDAGLFVATGGRVIIRRCVANNLRGTGFWINIGPVLCIECEAYACNQSNTSALGGFDVQSASSNVVRCIAHNNAGSNSFGYFLAERNFVVGCIAATNGGIGFKFSANFQAWIINSDAYENGSDGINLANTSQGGFYICNCNLVKNGGYGINGSGAGARIGFVSNCGFGAGTMANTSGTTTGLKSMVELGSVNYANDVTPWADPANGDFRISLTAAKGTGRGSYTQTASGYAGTVSYPDIGAAQHQDAGGGSGGGKILRSSIIEGLGVL